MTPIQTIDRVSINFTDKCNLNCTYCYKKNKQKYIEELTVQDIKDIYDKYEPKILHFIGGEPSLRWNDFIEIVKYVVPKMDARPQYDSENFHQFILMVTNGTTNIDFETIPKEYRHRVGIGFSIDGFEEITDKNRGKGTYKKAHESLLKCKKAGLFTGISMTNTYEDYLNNLKEFEKFFKFYALEIGVHGFNVEYPVYPNDKRMSELITSKQSCKAYNELHKIINRFSKPEIFSIKSRKDVCRGVGIHIHSNGEVNPKCPLVGPVIGYWTEWSKKDLIKWLNYCQYKNYDCKTIDTSDIKKYAETLLKLSKEEKNEK